MQKHNSILLTFLFLSFFQLNAAVNPANSLIDKDLKNFEFFKTVNSDRSTFQLITHGKPGHLLINGEWKNANEIVDIIKPLLSQNINQLNIFGCEFGKGNIGEEAVATLQNKLGINVSASNNITGKDGDWNLEVGLPTSIAQFSNYQFNLQTCAGVKGGTLPTDDYDGDGYCNDVDLDDDNDGILDVNEGLKCGVTNMTDFIGTKASTTPTATKTIAQNGYPAGTNVTLDLVNGAGDGTFEVVASPPFTGRDIATGGDGNGLAVVGPINSSEGKKATFTFGAPVFNLKFSVADIDYGGGAGPEAIKINAYLSDGTLYDLSKAVIKEYQFDNSTGAIIKVTDPYTGATVANNTIDGTNSYAHAIWKFDLSSTCTATKALGFSKIEFIFTGTQTTDVSMSASLFDLSYCGGPDSDGDCIPDYLDKDSDGDGCPDALEGSSTTIDINNVGINNTLSGAVDSNGVPLIAAGGQTGVTNLNPAVQSPVCLGCAPGKSNFVDTDGDGVGDPCDLDKDGDGIPDTLEGLVCGSTNLTQFLGLDASNGVTASKTIPQDGYPSGTNVNLTLVNGAGDGTFAVVASPPFAARDIATGGDGNGIAVVGPINSTEGKKATFSFSAPVFNLKFSVADIDYGGLTGPEAIKINAYLSDGTLYDLSKAVIKEYQFDNATGAIIKVTDPYTGATVANNTIDGTNSYAHAIWKFDLSSTCTATKALGFTKIEFIFTGSKTTDVSMSASLFDLTYCGGPDTDGDCIPDYLDKDSDNDGCPDALEGGAPYNTIKVSSTNTIVSPVSSTGIPTVVGATGQTAGTSTNASLVAQECIPHDSIHLARVSCATCSVVGCATADNLPKNMITGYKLCTSPAASDYTVAAPDANGCVKFTSKSTTKTKLALACVIALGPNGLVDTTFITIPIAETLLPVQLLQFTGGSTENGNVLNWTTAREVNFDKFVIEKSTSNKSEFSAIAEVKGGSNKYKFVDANTIAGLTYYRLKMIDLDGTYNYSNSISILSSEHNATILYPNPVESKTFKIRNNFELKSYQLVSSEGKNVPLTHTATSTEHIFTVIGNIETGVHVFNYETKDGQVISKKIQVLKK